MNIRKSIRLYRIGNVIQRAGISHSSAVNIRRNNNEIHTNEDKKTPLGYNKQEFEQVMKVLQRFHKNPHDWPKEDQPFAMVDRNFFKKVMHVSEFTPHRGFAFFAPFGMMLLRHAFRRFTAKQGEKKYGSEDFLNEENIMAGTKQAFEVIAQNAYNNTMDDLVKRGVCKEEAIQRFTAAASQMSDRQRNLFNITKEDIFAIAPGPYKHFQALRPYQINGEPFVLYSLLCCAFYKKQVLYDAVRDVPLLDESEEAEALPIPAEYGYDAPRTVYGYLTFGNALNRSDYNKVDSEVKLLDFQFVVQ